MLSKMDGNRCHHPETTQVSPPPPSPCNPPFAIPLPQRGNVTLTFLLEVPVERARTQK